MIIDDAGMGLLDEAECLALLHNATIGRVAVSIGAVPAVFPVNFTMVDGAVAFLTGNGTKLDAAVREAVIAFEIDDFDPVYHQGWSVLVVGTARERRDRADVERALAAGLAAWAPGHKEHLIWLEPEFMSGRRILVHHEANPADVLV